LLFKEKTSPEPINRVSKGLGERRGKRGPQKGKKKLLTHSETGVPTSQTKKKVANQFHQKQKREKGDTLRGQFHLRTLNGKMPVKKKKSLALSQRTGKGGAKGAGDEVERKTVVR